MPAQCEAITKAGRCCPNKTEHTFEGHWLCHIHHPRLTFHQQVVARRMEKHHAVGHPPPKPKPQTRRRTGPPLNVERDRPSLETPGLDAPLTLGPDAGRAFLK
jgi:hypothetical protein